MQQAGITNTYEWPKGVVRWNICSKKSSLFPYCRVSVWHWQMTVTRTVIRIVTQYQTQQSAVLYHGHKALIT
jgi:hypothetical protein